MGPDGPPPAVEPDTPGKFCCATRSNRLGPEVSPNDPSDLIYHPPTAPVVCIFGPTFINGVANPFWV